jgi:hypothetical protein
MSLIDKIDKILSLNLEHYKVVLRREIARDKELQEECNRKKTIMDLDTKLKIYQKIRGSNPEEILQLQKLKTEEESKQISHEILLDNIEYEDFINTVSGDEKLIHEKVQKFIDDIAQIICVEYVDYLNNIKFNFHP